MAVVHPKAPAKFHVMRTWTQFDMISIEAAAERGRLYQEYAAWWREAAAQALRSQKVDPVPGARTEA